VFPNVDLGFPRTARVLEEHGVIFSEKAHENVEVADLFGLDTTRLPITGKAEPDGYRGLVFKKYQACLHGRNITTRFSRWAADARRTTGRAAGCPRGRSLAECRER
jgi:hypothetical protein